MVDTTGPGPSIVTGTNGHVGYEPGVAAHQLTEPVEMRIERDSLGEFPVPKDAYWGVHTARALVNFPITRRAISNYPDLIVALAWVKKAAVRANRLLGDVEPEIAGAIEQACDDIIAGSLHDQFVLGAIQGGAGTSTNMCANEIIANRALEILGYDKGDYQHVHPIDDVNRSQSTNDVYPTAIKLAMVLGIKRFLDQHQRLADAFQDKGNEFADVLKVGRTQLQDAVPMTLGQEFHAFHTTLTEDHDRLTDVIPFLCEINLGATAIGTGITADSRYAETVRAELADITGLDIRTAPDLIEATSDTGVFMTLSGALKRSAAKLSKICNDLRLLSSGPQAGLNEINLPAVQAGSSIMPGKVNPVIPEVVNQVAYAVIGSDATVTAAAEAGQLQLNAFEPVIASSILQSLAWMERACETLRDNCVLGITANIDKLHEQVSASVGVVTALTPYIGYQKAATLAHEALTSGRSIRELVLDAGLMAVNDLNVVLQPGRLSGSLDETTQLVVPELGETDSD
jgi:aspartate ammonia-lyase